MNVGEFLAKTPDALKAAQDAVVRTRGSLDNWLVTLATTLLAFPTLLGKGLTFKSTCMWLIFVVADALLLLCIALILVRSEIFLARVNRRAAVLGEMASALAEPEQWKKGVPELNSDWQRRLKVAGSLQATEPWLSVAALASFLIGVLLLSLILILQSRPGEVTTSANNRLKLAARGRSVAE